MDEYSKTLPIWEYIGIISNVVIATVAVFSALYSLWMRFPQNWLKIASGKCRCSYGKHYGMLQADELVAELSIINRKDFSFKIESCALNFYKFLKKPVLSLNFNS